MPKGRHKPSFDSPSAEQQESAAWVYRSEDKAGPGDSMTPGMAITLAAPDDATPVPAKGRSSTPRTPRPSVIDVMTYPFALVTTLALFPVARLGARLRR